MAPRASATLARLMSCSSPPGATPVRAMLTQGAADLRRCLARRRRFRRCCRLPRAGIDPARYAVLQRQRRSFLAAAGVGVDVDQAGGDDLAARIDRLGGVARDVGLDRDDACRRQSPRRGSPSSPTEGSMTRPPLMIRS